ncbi:MAG TPA: RES family NAD+ phosphorylase [Puia sp.]|nr:RES family NAD+ phosphorylase [Puia sp.]
MLVYRMVKGSSRAYDITGSGAFRFGGRWNSPGTYMLYTSANSSLALLENLVHFDVSELPPDLFIVKIEVDPGAPVYDFPLTQLPEDWRHPQNLSLRKIGDEMMRAKKFLGFKVPSAVNPEEFNLLLNPSYPNYRRLVKVVSVNPYTMDNRLG